ncbi:non-ribosomal peptide synthetase [Parachlamydia acanthamoebae]|uniref:non-ribosomal peptide synthetase n=1 Tax=Parachlamydia acanthamoebae TaxID=83552 RepID=UPI0007510412|nr:non-ribosomal peptide synthetase [Parachlamydia acanthamoebae]
MNDLVTALKDSLQQFSKKIALDDGYKQMTFEELNDKSERLAKHIQSKKHSGDFIGIYLERSLEFIVSILGVLKSGNAYIPLDVHDPKARVKYIIDNSKAKYVITSSNNQNTFSSIETILIDKEEQWSSNTELESSNSSEFAYCIYTSGSTGNPKGVLIKKQSLYSYLNWCLSTYFTGLNEGTVLHSSLSYDMSVTSIFCPILLGQKITIIPDENPILSLLNILKSGKKFNFLKLTPSHLKIIKEELDERSLKDKVNNLIIGGEPLFYEDVVFWKDVSESMRIFNEYGPTEATVGCSVFEIFEIENGPVPIGLPIPNTHLFILNESFEPVPLGVAGELFIAGECLAHGYLEDSSQTNAKFLNKTILKLNKTYRLYKTGDLVKLLPGKKLIYIGRKDEQVKISGYRVELGEISHALKLHGDIKDAYVCFDKTHQSLIAYFTAKDFTPSEDELLEFLRDQLPRYMIPKKFVSLEHFPLTKNGKIDIQSLPNPIKKAQPLIIDLTSFQKKLCEIWQSVLCKSNISIKDNFFELGGDSISCIHLIGKAKQHGIHIQLKDIFEYPTIEDLEPHCQIVDKAIESTVRIEKKQLEYPLSPIQRWFFEQEFVDQDHYNQSGIIKADKGRDYEAAVKSLLSRHSVFFLNFKHKNETWVQVENASLQIDIGKRTLEINENEIEQIRLIGNQEQESLNIMVGPIGKVVVLETERSVYILFIFHHLIIDLISWEILFREFDDILKGKQLGDSNGTTYAAWIDSLPKSKSYFTPKNFQPANKIISKVLKENTVKMLQQINIHLPPFQAVDFIITALCLAFKENNHCCIAIESHGRSQSPAHLDISSTIGWFTHIESAYIELDPSDTLNKILENIHSKRHQITYDERSQDFHPKVCFNFLGKTSTKNYSNFQLISDISLNDISRKNHLPFLLNINSWIDDGKIKLNWFYNDNEILDCEVIKFSNDFEINLNNLIEKFSAHDHEKRLIHLARENEYSLGPLQYGLFYNAMKSADSNRYIIQRVFEVSANVNIEFLKKAWIRAISHFDILRNGFSWEKEQPYQFTLYNCNLPWNEVDLSDDSDLNLISENEKKKGFDLANPPLMRFLLCHSDKIYLVWTLHHIIIDGWSSVLVLDFIERTYKEFCQGTVTDAQPIKQYKDYVNFLNVSKKEHLESFWNKYLDKYTPSFISEIGRTMPKSHIRTYENWDGVFDQSLTNRLKAKAKSYGVTLNAIIQASWAIFLHKHLNTSDVAFGITFSGRMSELEGIADIVGVLINTLPLRLQIANKTFKSLCKEAHLRTAQIQLNGQLSLNEIHLFSKEKSREVFDHILVFENFPYLSDSQKRILQPSSQYASIVETEYPLTIVLMPEDRIKIEMSYDTQFFSQAMIVNFAQQWEHILNYLCENEDCDLKEIQLSCSLKKKKSWKNFNDTKTDFLPTLNDLLNFSPLNKHKIALIEGSQKLNFLDFDCFTNYIAKLLKNYSNQHQAIGIFLDRSIYFPLAAWSCVKAGIPFVPIETKFPKERIDYILKDSFCNFVITSSFYKDCDYACNFLNIDEEFQNKEKWEYTRKEEYELNDENAAYLIYTSGSSGLPKGVVIPRRALANYLLWCFKHYIADVQNGTVLHSSIAFDMSITALFLPLIAGQPLHILPEGLEVNDLISLLRDTEPFSFLKLTPSHLRVLHHGESSTEIYRKVKNLVLGGEQLLYEDINSYMNQECSPSIFNEYGPTEATVGCCVFKCENQKPYLKGPVPIGKPIANTQLFALNGEGNLCSILEEGELFIGGDGLARGYTNEKLTDISFIRDQDHSRRYQTGDIVRLSTDMDLVYIRRRGRQIKLNGYRIELEEIEHAISSHGDIKAAVVDFDSEQHILTAYFVPDHFSPSFEEIYDYVKTKLPLYMVPGRYIEIPSIPLNSNGKVDLQKIKLLAGQFNTKKIKKMPNTHLEYEIHAIWMKIFDYEGIGIEDNFFTIGGHSILAVKMLTEIKQRLDYSVSLHDFLKNPTIQAVAALIEQEGKEVSFPIWISFSNKNSDSALVLIHPGGGLSYAYSLLSSKIQLENIDIFAINNPYFGKDAHFQSIEEMAQEYVNILKQKLTTRRIYLGGWSFGGNVAFEMARHMQRESFFQIENVFLFDSYNHTHVMDVSQFRTKEVILKNIDSFLKAKSINLESKYADDLKNEMLRNSMLSRKFYPKSYEGSVTLFKARSDEIAQEDFPFNGWEVVSEKLKVEHLSSCHSQLFDPENVLEISGKVSTYF